MVDADIPKRDIIWITEQPDSEFRRALRVSVVVVSPAAYNASTEQAVVCRIASEAGCTPYEIEIPEYSPVTGVILVDQLRNVDWQATNAIVAAHLPSETIDEMLCKLSFLCRQ